MSVDGNPQAPLVSVIIVTYGTGPVVVDALDALARFTAVPHEVIVVDNPPEDGRPRSARLLGERRDIELVESDTNRGFAGGNELGVERAHGEFLCFLNPDVVVGPGWLEPLVEALADPMVGIAAPVLINPDGSLQEAGQLLYCDACTAAVGGPEVMTGDWSATFSRDVDYASAACWVVRRREHVARGGFDRRFHPAYFEDVDYAVRVEREGLRSRLVAEVPLVHHHGLGGAGQSLALGERSQATFRSIWAELIADRPGRPHSDDEALINRDRLAQTRRVTVVRATGADTAELRRVVETGQADASAHPRDRVTIVTDTALPDAATNRARAAGLELVVASPPDIDAVVAARLARGDDVTTVDIRNSSSRRRVLLVGVLLLVGVAGLVVRWLVLRSPAGILGADEAYTGLESFEILDGHLPIVLGGTAYTLPFEGYLLAPITWATGASVTALKLLSTVSWAIASIGLALLTSRLAGRRAGLVAGALCLVTPGALLLLSVTGYSAYASGLAVSVFAFLVASIALDAPEPRRTVEFAFGVLAGFGFWLHPMFLATLVPMVLTVLWMRRRQVATWLLVIGGGVLGCSPLLLWNVRNSWPSLDPPVEVEGTYLERLRTFGEDLLPRAFGLRDGALAWQPNAVVAPLLYVALIGMAVYGLIVVARRSGPPSRWLLVAVLVGVFPIMAVFENLIFAFDGRYGVISFPFLVVAIAAATLDLAGRATRFGRAGAPVVFGALAVIWIVGLIVPTLQPLVDETDGDPNAHLRELVDDLDAAGIDHVYGSYWAVLPVDFVGDRDITGGVFPFWPIRFPERQRDVESQPVDEVAILFLTSDEEPSRLPLPADDYERRVYGDIVAYLPLATEDAG